MPDRRCRIAGLLGRPGRRSGGSAGQRHGGGRAGADGLDDYRILIPALAALLAPGGVAIFEIGATQRLDVTALADADGYDVECRQDLAGHDRALILRAQRPA